MKRKGFCPEVYNITSQKAFNAVDKLLSDSEFKRKIHRAAQDMILDKALKALFERESVEIPKNPEDYVGLQNFVRAIIRNWEVLKQSGKYKRNGSA